MRIPQVIREGKQKDLRGLLFLIYDFALLISLLGSRLPDLI
jgi:hypothetical protein